MVFSPLVKRQVPFLHVPVWRFQIKNGLLSGDRFVGHWCQNATPNLNLQPRVRLKGEMSLIKYS
jgi:hypothetical protein